MRKVIKGKLYDTDKATLISEWESGYDYLDVHNFSECLYRKRTGEYFLYGRGGALSPYGMSFGNDRLTGGQVIRPLTYDEARDWLEAHGTADEYETEFGIPDEDAEHDLHVIVSEQAWQAISRAATTGGTSVRAVIERLALTL